ncbi:peptidoglycan DD-metalloendopeptidase family protein [Deinococcus aquaticus]|uniref:Peptidoglycan DD-metalloendopeptidase family protein n=1 Tax=Deinococcus aquaticus TaxID=328692 RepID=A0ABY7UZB1_9DEIO|nr:peptidoglycan DD-metalloendopeptidase family protein [Deinococcus aquaticus]WDA58259.1 peptidoglycan DD-metalloendopeptidase family protein [Deinococcus aquaticus]
MPFPFPRGLTFRAAVTGALLSAAMTAQAQQATPLEQLLLPLQPNLQVPADLTLDRAPRTLDILTNGTTPATAVARRYGVPASAVKVSATRKGLRYVRVTLADRDLTRRPQRPATVERYVVRPGDTMARVAARFGITLVDLLSLNLNRNSLDDLNAGAVLNVPTGETGLLVRIKPGQSALSLIAGYGADIVETARANDALPTELQVGDLLLLPGIRAESFVETLAKKREAERQAALAAERQRRYDAYLAQKKQRARERLEARYAAQEKYEEYLAWKSSPERQARVAAYERQAQYEAAQAASRARQTQARAAQTRQSAVAAASSGASSRSGLAWPMRSYRITSRFAERDIAFHQQVFHGGVDFAAPYGTPIYSASAGTVTESRYGAFGLNVYTTDGDSTIIYGHMSRTAVSAGQRVGQGQLLGYIGCTGVCTGPHLHFEVRIGGRQVDPLGMLP